MLFLICYIYAYSFLLRGEGNDCNVVCSFKNMNEENQLNTSEKIASKIMRVLAVIGVIAVLVLAVWLIVQGIKLLPKADNNISATVSSMRGIFSKATSTEESLVFDLEMRTLPVGDSTTLTWVYTGSKEPQTYTFAYSCGTETKLSVMDSTGWRDLTCNTPLTVEDTQITIVPTNILTRFSDVELRIEAGELRDTTIVTIFNAGIAAIEVASSTTATPTSSPIVISKPATKPATTVVTPTTPKPVVTTPVTRTVPLYNGPADLVIEIQETGILTQVSGKDAVRQVSPIPSNKTAAVTFTVTNKGGATSGSWIFKAELPIEGDSNYKYTSPVQAPLLSGMEVEYTLGFDEVLEARNGTIRLELVPSYSGDKSTNNKDSVTIKIDER